MSLAPPPDACALRGGEGYQIFMSLLGWFDGPRALVGARLGGTYWEGQFDDPQPCPGPEMISLDTDVVLTRG